jgi:outer membrane autotransporter protein
LEGYYNDKAKDKIWGGSPIEFESKGVFLNGYWDIPSEIVLPIQPYVSAGVGYSWLKETADYTSQAMGKESASEKDFGWQVGFGAAYKLNDNVDVTLGYRYEDLGKIKTGESSTRFINHKLSLGLRYTF